MKTILCIAAFFAGILISRGQPSGYRIFNRAFTVNQGVAHMDARADDGIAWITGKEFSEGTIELDVRGRDVMQQSFVGFAFHGADDSSFEAIYFRAFNFRSPDPVRRGHAVQYVAPPAFGWEKLRQEHPNVYENAVSPAPDPNEWFHVRIVVTEQRISVFVNGASDASLVVTPLVHRAGRMLGYWVGNGSEGDWKNLHIVTQK